MLKSILGRQAPRTDPAAETAGQSIMAMDRLFAVYLQQVSARGTGDPGAALSHQKTVVNRLVNLDPRTAMELRGQIYLAESATWPDGAQASFYAQLEAPWAPNPDDEALWRRLIPETRSRYVAQGAALNAQVLGAMFSGSDR